MLHLACGVLQLQFSNLSGSIAVLAYISVTGPVAHSAQPRTHSHARTRRFDPVRREGTEGSRVQVASQRFGVGTLA